MLPRSAGSASARAATGTAAAPGRAPFAGLPVRVIAMTDEEFAAVRGSLEGAGLANPVSRFAAIRGADRRDELTRDAAAISPRALYEIEEGATRESHSSMPSWGGVGCYLSHEALWREAAASPAGLLVAEADCRAAPGAAAESARVFGEVCALLGRPPELLWLGWVVVLEQTAEAGLKEVVRTPDRVLGTHFYYVSPAGARTLLSRSRPIEVQVDSYMGYMTKLARMDAFAPERSLFTQENEGGTKIQLKRVEDVMASPCPNSDPAMVVLLFACVVSLALAGAALMQTRRRR
jgi:GR25 family glycosyltransferase involved in LPS biosynthesis